MRRGAARIGWILSGAALCGTLVGCNSPTRRVRVDSPEMAAFVELMMPQKLEIEGFTKPASSSDRGNADMLEVIARALDADGDPIKIVGNFTLELYRRDNRGGGRLGERLEFWTVSTATEEDFATHWERFGRFYRFALSFNTIDDLPAGTYVVNAWVDLPTGDRIFDEYEFAHAGGPVPQVTLR